MVTDNITLTTITVQWGPVPCIHQNGAITGYSVRYVVMGSSEEGTEDVMGASETEITISNLTPSTTYLVSVAAVNDVGTGVFSDNESAMTLGIHRKQTICGLKNLAVH